jgi:hypothetical protein
MPLFASDEEGAGPENVTNTIEGQGGAGFPARRFIIRTAAAAAVDSDKEVVGPENESNTIVGQDGAGFPARRFITRTVAAAAVDREKKETTLATAIRIMELDSNLENLHIDEGLLHQMLENLETAHPLFMIRESLDINREPEKSYMSEFKGKVVRALIAQKVRLQLTDRQIEPEKEKNIGIGQEDDERDRKESLSINVEPEKS